MDLISTGSADPIAEVRQLRRQLARERARRRAAETLGERATSDLYKSLRELRAAQVDLLERADQARVVNELARALRQDLDSSQLVNRAAESVGHATGVDRCDILLVDADLYAAVQGTWSSSPENARLPRPRSFVDLPECLTALLIAAAQRLDCLQIEKLDEDSRVGPAGAAEIFDALGARALAAVPVAVGDEVVGWLLLQSAQPRAWQAREVAICEGLSHDLVSTLIQVQAFERQRESVRRLEELDLAKDTFISTVSHELRTPLTSIVGYLEMLSEGGLGPLEMSTAEGVEIIKRNVERLRQLVEDLLALSAYDAEQVRVDLRPTDLAVVVSECHEALVPALHAKEMELLLEIDQTLPNVPADHTQMVRVVLNLLSNAIKFSHAGNRVTVRLRADAEHVILSVIDSGIGIPVEEQGQLFARFFRSSLAVADEIQGTGLGLTLVQSVVESHGGTVEIDSVEGEGTTVTVRLRRASDCAPLLE